MKRAENHSEESPVPQNEDIYSMFRSGNETHPENIFSKQTFGDSDKIHAMRRDGIENRKMDDGEPEYKHSSDGK
jgi:hypothetical protein